jgi:hypothetical protein
MAQKINIPYQEIPVGTYVHEIQAPGRKDAALLTMTRQPLGWPAGPLFTYVVSERNRGQATATILTSGAEEGGPSIGKDGTVNPPFKIGLRWAADKDKDIIRFEVTVLQPFSTALSIEFI